MIALGRIPQGGASIVASQQFYAGDRGGPRLRNRHGVVSGCLILYTVVFAPLLAIGKLKIKMAMLPELSKLRVAPLSGEKVWPILQTENVFILPGVPEFFQSKMTVIADHFLDPRPMVRGVSFLASKRSRLIPSVTEVYPAPVLQKLDPHGAFYSSSVLSKTTAVSRRYLFQGEAWSSHSVDVGRLVFASESRQPPAQHTNFSF